MIGPCANTLQHLDVRTINNSPRYGVLSLGRRLVSLACVLGGVCLFVDALFLPIGPSSTFMDLWPYRCLKCQLPREFPVGRLPLPRDYFMPSRDRGFDIRPHRPITAHYVNDLTYPTWSNALGCFDREPDDNPTYAYLAGDSFAWGYVPYEATFGRRLEMSTGMPVLKCAVPHTGQRHQLAKMREIIATLPRPPAVTIVAFTPNDIANDLAHPHTVVLGGLLVDRAHLFRIDDEWVPRWTPRDRLEQDLRRREPNGGPRSTAEHVAFQISKVSLITALGYRAWAARQVHWDASYGVPIYVRDIWEHEGRLWYADNRYAKNNKLALRAFQRFCRTIGSQLILVLVPELPDARREGYFSELLGFTRASGIRTIDVGEAMRRNDVTLADFYNVGDPHLNARGHALVSSLLAREIGTRSWRDLRNGEGHTGRGIEIGGTLRW